MRDILHQNADSIASANASSLEGGGDFVHKADYIRVGELFGAFRLVQDERATVGSALRPFLNAIEDPAAGDCFINLRTGNLGQWSHASVE